MRLIAAVIAASLCGCVSSARLYPANDSAIAVGALVASYENYGTGRGSITIKMPDGEVLSGEYSTVDTTAYQFGTIYSATSSAMSSSVGSSGASPGTAFLIGTGGTHMDCEYVTSVSGNGN